MASATEENYVDVFLEFVEVLVHQVVYLHDIYPASVFAKKKKYRIPVMMSVHPWVNEYITKTVDSIDAYIRSPEADLNSVMIVLSQCGKVHRKIQLEFDLQEVLRTVSPHDEFLVQLELNFISMLLRLNQVVSGLKKTDSEMDWWVEILTTQSGAVRLSKSLDWGTASSNAPSTTSSCDTAGPSSVPLAAFGGSIVPVLGTELPIRMQIFIETFS